MSEVAAAQTGAWEVKPLADLAKAIQYGYTAKARSGSEGIRYLRITDIQDDQVDWGTVPSCDVEDAESEKYLLSAGDLVFARTGATVGKSFLLRGNVPRAVFASYLIRVKLRNHIDPRYVAYFFQSPAYWNQIAESSAGIGQPNVNGKKLAQIRIPVAPPQRQQEIVAELEKQFSRLDEAVANLQRVKANLKRYKASVLKDAVEGRLVPTEAELARRESRTFETGEQLLQRILEERRRQWSGRGKYKEAAAADASNLPELPEGRVWATLGQLTSSVKDGPHFSPKYAEHGVPFISGGNIRPEGIDFSSAKFISPELHAELSKRCKPEPGDLLYTKGGTTGIARVNTETREFNVWVHVAVLKLMESVHPFYLQHALNSPHCYRQSQKHTHGVGNQDLGLTRMVWITVPLPPYPEQLRIVDEVERRLSLVREVEVEVDANLKRAQALRQATLSKAFSVGLPK